jgi:hypothetical protein
VPFHKAFAGEGPFDFAQGRSAPHDHELPGRARSLAALEKARGFEMTSMGEV